MSKLDQVDNVKGGNTLDLTNDGRGQPQGIHSWMPETERNDTKKSAIHAEMARVNQLPPNSSYAVHRMRVLNKILHLMAIEASLITLFELQKLFISVGCFSCSFLFCSGSQRSRSQDEELELLFAGLSL